MKRQSIFKKCQAALSILLTVAVLCTVVFTVSANVTADDYGTQDGGIILNGTDDTVSSRTPVAYADANFDFSKGLQYYGPLNAKGDVSTAQTNALADMGVSYYADKGCVKITGQESFANGNGANYGFESVPVTIPDEAKGKTLYISADMATDFDLGLRLYIDGVVQKTSNNNANADRTKLWVYKNTLNNDTASGELKRFIVDENWGYDAEFTIGSEANNIAIAVFTNHIGTGSALIDNIVLYYKDGDKYYTLDGKECAQNGVSIYGTTEGGITLADNTDTVSSRTPVAYADANLDFSKGLQYFGPIDSKQNGTITIYTTYKSTLADMGVTYDADKGYAKITGQETFGTNIYLGYGFMSVPITIPAEAKGKTLYIGADAAIDFDLDLRLIVDGSIQNTSNGGKEEKLWIRKDTLNNASTTGELKTAKIVQSHTGKAEFEISSTNEKIAVAVFTNYRGTEGSALIDNIVLYYKDGDKYYTLDGKECDENGKIIKVVSPYGTEEEGITLTSKADTVGSRTAIAYADSNFDFSKGLQYYGPVNLYGQWQSTLAKEGVTLDNGKIKFSHTSEWSTIDALPGIESVPVTLPEWTRGKQLSIKLDVKSNKELRVNAIIDGKAMKDIDPDITSGKENLKISANNSDELVSTFVQNSWGRKSKISVSDTASTLAIRIQRTCETDGNYDTSFLAYIDNITFIFYDTETGKYYNFAQQECDENGVVSPYGSTEKGIILTDSNDSAANRDALNDFENFDFSNGLINFAPNSQSGFWMPTLSEEGIILENGMVKFQGITGLAENFPRGMQSVPVKIPDFAKGKELYVSLDTATNFSYAINVLIDGKEANLIDKTTADADMWIGNIGNTSTPTLEYTMAKVENETTTAGVLIPEDATTIAIRIYTTTVAEDKVAYIDNIKFLVADIGGLADKYTDLDGSAIGHDLGDANGDGEVDICDLVKLNDYIDDNSTEIYFATSDMDRDSVCNALDFTTMKEVLLGIISFTRSGAEQLNMLNYCADSFYYTFATRDNITEGTVKSDIDADMKKLIDGTPVDAVLLNTNYHMSYVPSKVMDMAWERTDGTKITLDNIGNHWQQYVIKTHNAGVEPYSIAIDTIKKYNAQAWFSVRMNEFHYLNLEYARSTMNNNEEYKNNENSALDFAHEEVRDYFKNYILELCKNYDIDGIELYLMRGIYYFSKNLSVKEKSDIMNAYLKEIKAGIEEINKRLGKDIKISARILSVIEENEKVGLDVRTWAKEGLFDRINVANFHTTLDNNIEIEKWRAIFGSTPITVGADCAVASTNSEYKRRLTVDNDLLRGFSKASLERGADGIYIFNHFIMSSDIDMNSIDPKTGKNRVVFTFHEMGDNEYTLPITLNDGNKSQKVRFFVGKHKSPEILIGFKGDNAPTVKVNGEIVKGTVEEGTYKATTSRDALITDSSAVAPKFFRASTKDISGTVEVEFTMNLSESTVIWLEISSD